MHRLCGLGILLLCASAGNPALAAEDFIAVIVGASSPIIDYDTQTLREVFLKRITVDDHNVAVVPLNLPPANTARLAFTASLWGGQPEDQQGYWNERYFHGVTPPYVVLSDEAMLRFVTETPGAIGYVAACRVDARVRVVAQLPITPALLARVRESCGS